MTVAIWVALAAIFAAVLYLIWRLRGVQSAQELTYRSEQLDKSAKEVTDQLKALTNTVHAIDRKQAKELGSLTQGVVDQARVTRDLGDATTRLNQALSGGQARGQWGERMAEDVLRVAGFKEGVQYRKQQQFQSGRPDFTFLLPEDLCLNMDAKFPGAAYLRYHAAQTDTEKEAAAKQFRTDVRARIKEVTKREYIDPANGTVDCVLVFIPNERILDFIQEHDPEIFDFAIGQKVVLCSPATLFAVLAVVRQATENFHLTRQTNEILEVLGRFSAQWEKFKGQMATVGKALESAVKAQEGLEGTRQRMLDNEVERVEKLRTAAEESQISAESVKR